MDSNTEISASGVFKRGGSADSTAVEDGPRVELAYASPKCERRLAASDSAAKILAPFVDLLFSTAVPVRFVFWDGSSLGPLDGPGTVRVVSPEAIRRIAWAPGELGVSRAFVAGDLEIEGDTFAVLRALQDGTSRDLRRLGIRILPKLAGAVRQLNLLGRPPRPPQEEIRPSWRPHSLNQDARAISHHYDVGNDFYRLILGPSMAYSCARFVGDSSSLEGAQEDKHELVCRKLGLDSRPGSRLLDVGCGWGSMAIHAAREHDAHVVGITLSQEQVALARQRVAAAGVADRVEIRLQDYRRLGNERFDAVSSIGMFEHVGASRASEYFDALFRLLNVGGRLLNHAISSPGGSRIGHRTFIGRYVFPDGELIDVGDVVLALERAGFEVRDVESLREHYSRTLHAWVENLRQHWGEAVDSVGAGRVRIWNAYMAASANGFDDGGLAVHQVLGVKPSGGGQSGMPATRRSWN